MSRIFVWLPLAVAAAGLTAWAQATIDIDTTHSTTLNANFSGFNDEVVFPAEYFDYRLENLAATLTPGWVRYPSGTFSSAFNWQTGLMAPAWAAEFQSTPIASLVSEGVPWVNGKGGGSFVDAANRANFLGAKLIVCVNGFTDTAQSAGQMAAFAKANRIPVAVWELSNEPYTTGSTFFTSGADYVAKMRPFYNAIKAADASATVAIFFQDAGDPTPNPPWNTSVLSYSPQYWDAITYHHYPPQSTGAFSQWMADENAVLASKTSAFVTGYLEPLNPPGTKFLISEFLPSNDGGGTSSSVTDGTLYGAIYAAEYVMRMSSVPAMLYVGMHALTGTRGVTAVNSHYTDVQNAYAAGTTIDTLTLDFGYYLDTQPLGLAVLNGVLHNASQVDATTVTGGATVPATGLGQIPALFAQAYTSNTGQQSVVITNKGAAAQTVAIRVNGTAVSGTLPLEFIAGTDPSAANTAAAMNAVTVQTGTSSNPVTVPAYSVVRVDLNAPAAASVVSSASYLAGPVAAQEIVAIFGTGVASQTASASLPLPTVLGGTSVRIADSAGNTQLAQLFAVSASQANVLVPSGLAAGPATVTVLHGTTAALTGSISIAGSQPGIYSMNQDGAGVAAAIAYVVTAASQKVPETVYTCDSSTARSCLAAPLGQGGATDTLYVELYGTGIRGAASVQCFAGGQSVPVIYAGTSSYAGLDQVDISIPKSLAGMGDVRVYLVADGVASNVVGLNLQ
jgi:uncharacterized protein (TIGR03437 family)